jgi:hypothetical protein
VSTPEETLEAIPLLPRRRLIGSVFGGHASLRRGEGVDVAGSRPYRPGDHYHSIDWKSSARLSSLRDDDEFIVRERHAEEMARVLIVCDRRPELGLYPEALPWLHKPLALHRIVTLIARSAVNQRGLVGYLDYGGHEGENEAGTPFWRPPRAQASFWQGETADVTAGHLRGRLDAPQDNLSRALDFIAVVGGVVTSGSFVFVVSDFLVGPTASEWSSMAENGYDVIPVIVQEPVWEQSFPPLGGVLVPIVDARDGSLLHVRMTEREAEERRAAHEERLRNLLESFGDLGLDPILISSHDAGPIRSAFLEWSERRLSMRGLPA